MPGSAADGGTQLVAPPTFTHHLPNAPSNQDLESAALLERLHNDQGPKRRELPASSSATVVPSTPQSDHPLPSASHSKAADPTEYHALEDSIRHAPERSPSVQTPPSHVLIAQQQVNNAPITGQICSNCGTNRTPLWRRSPEGQTICNACGLYYKARNQHRPTGLKRNTVSQPATSILEPVSIDPAADRSTTPPLASSTISQAYIATDQLLQGTCPGGGRCNGTGGQAGCNGCPAYNNRVSKTAQFALAHVKTTGQADSTRQPPNSNNNQGLATQTASAIPACHNCETTITPLWRRDDQGHTICNACGLYFKLHNRHRPFTMKKQEIKRRKRVMPAEQILLQHQNAEQGHQPYPYEQSTPPNHRPASSYVESKPQEQIKQHDKLPLHERSIPHRTENESRPHLRAHIPLPADFTAYRPSPTSNQIQSLSGYTPAANESHARKRNYAETEDTNPSQRATRDERSITEAQRASLEAAIDPSLSAGSASLEAGSKGSSVNTASQKAKSKEELEAEVKHMKELLLAAEGELARLKHDEQETST